LLIVFFLHRIPNAFIYLSKKKQTKKDETRKKNIYNKPKQMQTHKDRNEYTGRDKRVAKRRFTAMLLFLFFLKLIFDRQNNEHTKKNRTNSNETEVQKKIHHS
jgi:hypothetical protein